MIFNNLLHKTTIMGKLIINSYDEFASHLGEQLGISEWLTVDQERINKFADATLDHQWIHVDVERAKVESPYKSTIAHGYLTLSILPYLWNQIIEVNNLRMMVNYGMDKMKFGQPVITGSRVRLVARLQGINNLRGICKAEIDFTIEIEGQRKPDLKASPLSFTTSSSPPCNYHLLSIGYRDAMRRIPTHFGTNCNHQHPSSWTRKYKFGTRCCRLP